MIIVIPENDNKDDDSEGERFSDADVSFGVSGSRNYIYSIFSMLKVDSSEYN